jgi:hypothetical protein
MKKVIKRIDVLNIAQPWVTCIFKHGKNIENNYSNKKQRGTVAIYCTKRNTKSWFDQCREDYKINLEFNEEWAGCIVGFADIDIVLEPGWTGVPKKYLKWWNDESYGLVLSNLRLLKKPIPVEKKDGIVRWWNLEGKNLSRVLKAMTKKEIAEYREWKVQEDDK